MERRRDDLWVKLESLNAPLRHMYTTTTSACIDGVTMVQGSAVSALEIRVDPWEMDMPVRH